MLDDLVVIFDLDGTLVDSAPDLAGAMNAVLRAEGLAPVPSEDVRPLVGDGARALLVRGFAENDRVFPEGEAGDALVARFLAHYAAHLTDGTRPFPGAEAALGRLAGAGASLAVCTNKPERLTWPLLDGLGLTPWFAVVLGRDSLPQHKPDALPLLTISERTGRRRGVMVGDTATDRDAARAANMPFLLARFGYGPDDLALRDDEQRFEGFEALFDLIGSVSASRCT